MGRPHSFSVVTRTWAPEIILELADRGRRFNQMLDNITGISDRVLTERLRDLETGGLVVRDVDPGPPVRVSYRLTRDALPYVEPLQKLARIEELARGVPLDEVAI